MDYSQVSVIGFDADDTLWENENLFREVEEKFCDLLAPYDVPHNITKLLYSVEMQNLEPYGYGIKGFMLSLIETALTISGNTVSSEIIHEILKLGNEMIQAPVILLPEVEPTLEELTKHYRLVLVTKGDLRDQERKLRKSNLESYFHHVEILSDKKPTHYQRLTGHLDIMPKEFLMIGNSIKSDVLPVIKAGAMAIHIPYHVTWEHEMSSETDMKGYEFKVLKQFSDLIEELKIKK